MALIHGTGILYEGKGLLIMGPSGSGKSDLALRMIGCGALLIGDDYVEISQEESGLAVMETVKNIAGKIEVHNVGILDVPFQSQCEIDLVLNLVGDVGQLDRLPEIKKRTVDSLSLPCLDFYGFEPSAPEKIKAALAIFT